jgi:hypothetical protein
MRSKSPTLCVMIRRPGLERRACTCGQRIWRRALLAMAAQTLAAAAARRDSASAMTFDVPGCWAIYYPATLPSKLLDGK